VTSSPYCWRALMMTQVQARPADGPQRIFDSQRPGR
jgi:hypothetical protein